METFEFPESLLEAASTITLKDLLDAPFSQPWLVSALANASHFAHQQSEVVEADVVLAARVERLVRSIPQEEKLELYRHCSAMVQSRKAKQRKRTAGEPFHKGQN